MTTTETTTVTVHDETTREALLCAAWQPIAGEDLFPEDPLHDPAERAEARATLKAEFARTLALWQVVERIERAQIGESVEILAEPAMKSLIDLTDCGRHFAGSLLWECDHRLEAVAVYEAMSRILSELTPEAAEVSR